MNPDPLALHDAGQGDLNLYAYVRGMALKAVDPLGLDTAIIVFEGPGADAFHQAAAKWARNLAKAEPGRHVVSVGIDAREPELRKAWDDAAKQAGKGATKEKRVVFVGHGDGDVNDSSSFTVQLRAVHEGSDDTTWQISRADMDRASKPTMKETRERRFQEFFGAVRSSLDKNGVDSVELFGCNLGRDKDGLQVAAGLFGRKTVGYRGYAAAAEDGSTTSVHRQLDGPAIAGSTSKGLPSDTPSAKSYTEEATPAAASAAQPAEKK